MDDKFIVMNMNDERSKHVAEILANKTCKKIIDYLAETKEVSEKDISDALKMPINTVEYNLQKLLKSGLVEKTKNFFWSRKGKKIPMYKLSRKHIVISPSSKSSKPNMNILKTLIPVILVIAVGLLIVLLMLPKGNVIQQDNKLKQFSSNAELSKFLQFNSENYEVYSSGLSGRSATVNSLGTASSESVAPVATQTAADSSLKGGGTSDYSTTNIQVEGVDEADIVKNDEEYIYSVSGNRVIITKAYPAEQLENISEIELTGINGIFVNGDRLVVFTNDYGYGGCLLKAEDTVASSAEGVTSESMIAPCSYNSEPKLSVNIYNIEDRENPVLENKLDVEGNYISSRMIDNYVYVIGNKYVDSANPEPPIYALNGVETSVRAQDVYYWDYPDYNYVFTTITALNIEDGKYENKVYLTGYSNTIYVSEKNIYFTTDKRVSYNSFVKEYAETVALKVLPEKANEINSVLDSDFQDYKKMRELQEIIYDHSYELKGKEKEDFDTELMQRLEEFNEQVSKEMEKTLIHKVTIDKTSIEYTAQGEVSGYLLNQYSMDENDGNLRVAVTTGNWRDTSLNHLYVLNKDLKVIGSIEDLAKGERIYSVRFMGDRAYMVTFRQVDPLYVIDLSTPSNPKVLGYLKVTGYSSYLHPYDENHIIGIGKEADANGRVQGLKIALFDVTDVENPVEESKYEVGAEWSDDYYHWSDSNALYDPKAFLFNKDKELLVIPVTYNKNNKINYSTMESFQGAYVFKINLQEGIRFRGKIEHKEENTQSWWYYPDAIQRSLYMGNFLYTISTSKIKANSLTDLTEIKEIDFGYEEDYSRVLYGTTVSGSGSSGSE
jgi:uncharacterized secreted protein with C-terminal beta-propeller domain